MVVTDPLLREDYLLTKKPVTCECCHITSMTPADIGLSFG